MINEMINNEIIEKLNNEKEIYIVEVDNLLYLEIQTYKDENFILNLLKEYNIEYSDFEAFNNIQYIVYNIFKLHYM